MPLAAGAATTAVGEPAEGAAGGLPAGASAERSEGDESQRERSPRRTPFSDLAVSRDDYLASRGIPAGGKKAPPRAAPAATA